MGRVLFVRYLLMLAAVSALAVGCGSLKEEITDTSVKKLAKEYLGYQGSGSDGALIVDGSANGPLNPKYTDDVRTYLTGDALIGATELTVNSTTGFAVGQEILIIGMKGTSAGKFETGKIASITTKLVLEKSISNGYKATAGSEATQVLKVPQYDSVTVLSGGFLTVHNWDGFTGGVMFFRSLSDVWIKEDPGLDGTITVEGVGYAGAAANTASTDPGGGVIGAGGKNLTPVTDPTTVYMGGGGGGSASAQAGARGGGIMMIKSGGKVIVDGYLKGGGKDGTSSGSDHGGAGAGGLLWIVGDQITTNNLCYVDGLGGDGGNAATDGGDGRVFMYYKTKYSCTPGPDPKTSDSILEFKLE